LIQTSTCQLYLSNDKEELNDLPRICARCHFDENGATRWLVLTPENDNSASKVRYQYDEDRLTSLCRIEGKKISLVQKSPFTFIESVVAMNRHLHKQLFSGAAGRWLFTGIDLQRGCDEREKLTIDFKHNMNYRLTKSDILIDEKKVGDIFFSLRRP
jgi:hypothetical protein